jgi:hypothetical protein
MRVLKYRCESKSSTPSIIPAALSKASTQRLPEADPPLLPGEWGTISSLSHFFFGISVIKTPKKDI